MSLSSQILIASTKNENTASITRIGMSYGKYVVDAAEAMRLLKSREEE